MKKENKNINIQEEQSPELDWLKSELARLDEVELPEDFEETLTEKLKAEEKKAPVFGMINEDEKVKMAKTIAYLLIPLAAAFVLIVGLSMYSLKMGSGSKSQTMDSGGYADSNAVAMDTKSEETETSMRFDSTKEAASETGDMALAEDANEEEMKAEEAKGEDAKGSAIKDTEKHDLKLIYRAFLGVEIESYNDFNSNLRAKLKECEGYVETSDQQVDTVMRRGQVQELIYGSYTLRVPAQKYEDFLKYVQEEAELKYKNENVENVTAEYRDIEEGVKNLKIKEETLRGFLKDAKNAEESMLIFSHLTDTRAEIDRLESRLKNIDKLVSYSTIEINVREKEKIVDIEPIDEKLGERISKRFNESINYLTALAEDFIVALTGDSPIYLLVIVCVLIAALILVVVVKKLLRRLNK